MNLKEAPCRIGSASSGCVSVPTDLTPLHICCIPLPTAGLELLHFSLRLLHKSPHLTRLLPVLQTTPALLKPQSPQFYWFCCSSGFPRECRVWCPQPYKAPRSTCPSLRPPYTIVWGRSAGAGGQVLQGREVSGASAGARPKANGQLQLPSPPPPRQVLGVFWEAG